MPQFHTFRLAFFILAITAAAVLAGCGPSDEESAGLTPDIATEIPGPDPETGPTQQPPIGTVSPPMPVKPDTLPALPLLERSDALQAPILQRG